MTEPILHPAQTDRGSRGGGKVRSEVTFAAYEVYCHVFSPQPAMVEGNCRGGFSAGELIAFLYARSFPKSEWRVRFNEALSGMTNL